MLHIHLYRRIAATLVAASLAGLLAGCETMTTSFGKSPLSRFTVWTDEVEEALLYEPQTNVAPGLYATS